MNRCLHVTIRENSKATPRSATRLGQGRTSTDPGEPFVMPPVDDPGEPFVMPPVDDPGEPFVMPPVDDPRYRPYPAGSSRGCGEAMATVSSCCGGCHCGCGTPATAPSTGTATPHPYIAPRDFTGFVIVRTAQGVDPNAASLWELAGPTETPKLPGLKAVLELPFKEATAAQVQADALPQEPRHLISRPLVELQGQVGGPYGTWGPLPRGECLDRIRELESLTAVTAFPPLQSLTAYWRLDVREHPGLVEEVVAQLNRLAEVDLAYRELSANDPADEAGGQLFAEDQGYLSDAPIGISASWAWKSLDEMDSLAPSKAQATPMTICDLEQGWNPGHNDFQSEKLLPGFIYGANRDEEGTPGHHGTAVLGQLAAAGGVKGAAAGLGQFALASHYKSKDEVEADGQPHPFAGTNGHVAASLVQALEKQAGPLGKGDILLLEVQRGRLPTEVDEADFNAIRLASGLGVIVIEAAGNGGFDLDAWGDPDTGRSLQRGDSRFRDSGAVLVGAARASLPHDRAPFSNHGSRLDCFGWGEAVTTCGYGDLAGTAAADFYTNSFSGTSSASPIVAGAAALLQTLHLKATQSKLEPRAMRALLSDPATGTRQGLNVPGHIGVMPDLRAIVNVRLQLVPIVYMRRSVCDDGSTPGPDDEISSSPDILVWKGGPNQDPIARFGEGPRANHPAPGNPIHPEQPNNLYSNNNNLYVRLRNRGVGEGRVTVRLFASPAATLITPERWMPIGSLKVPGIPQGDTLTVSQPLQVNLPDPQKWPQDGSKWGEGVLPSPAVVPAYSFLAVQLPWDEPSQLAPGFPQTAGLPPGPPYFDWAEYRSFLRGPGVAWRNVHPIRVLSTAQAGTTMTLPFLFAGTPDRTRHFDFEVIQRLPAEVEVTLKVPDALAAKLRQRQPWLSNGAADLKLPHRLRTALRQVAFAPGVHAHSAFHVKLGPNSLLRGNSLAIRQLWRGEEVGRITWWFIDE